jgi:hypothetical protein
MSPAVARLRLIAVAAWAAAAAWLSQGVTAFTHAGGDRIVMLPLSARAAALVALAAVAVTLLARRGESLAPLALLAFLFLPWVLIDAPPIFLLWLGPLTLLVWAAVVALLVSQWRIKTTLPDGTGAVGVFRQRPALTAGLLALTVYSISAWQVSPSVPAGDEPHYLVITQSLLRDGDLRIENNHRRGDYQEYYRAPLQPDFRLRGRDGHIYSIHPPGISALVAPAFAIGGYPAAVIFLIVIAAAGSALAWTLALQVTGDARAAWFGWSTVTFSATSIFHSFTVYPDGPGGVLVLTGVWALVRAQRERDAGTPDARPWLLHGLALAALPWFHPRFAVFAGTLGALVLLRLSSTRNAAAKAVAFLIVPAISALAWIGYFIAIYGTPDPSAPYAGEAGSFSFVPGGIVGLLFDQRFGLLAYAPVLAAGFLGLGVMIARRVHTRLAVEMLFVLMPYLLTVTHFAMWWGGWSAPARFAAPFLPMLAIPAAVFWTSIRDAATRAAAFAALAVTAFASAVLVFADGGRLAYNVIREPAALWLPRLTYLVDIAAGLPLWSRTADYPLFRDTAIWIGAFALAWAALRLGSSGRTVVAHRNTVTLTLTIGVYVVAAMAALAAVWRVRGAEGLAVAPAQLEMLRYAARSTPVLALQMNGPQLVSRDNVPGRLRIELPRVPEVAPDVPRAARDQRPMFAVPAVPAAEYRIAAVASDRRGWVMLGVGRDQFALRTESLGAVVEGIEFPFAANLGEFVVRGDEDARQAVRTLRIEPLSLTPQRMRATDAFARSAVRYGQITVYFLDDRSFPEPEAFWVAGGRDSSIVVQPAEPIGGVELHLRNAPVENRLLLKAGAWREALTLAPGEERRVRVPLDTSRDATLIHLASSSGFKPSAVDRNSRDNRFLGVWIRIE